MGISFKGKKGFTLIELITVLSIVVVVIGAVSSFLISNIKTYNMASDQIEVQDQAKKAMEFFIDKAIEAKGIGRIVNDSYGNLKVFELIDSSDHVYAAFHIDRVKFGNENIELGFGTDIDHPELFELVAENLTAFTLEPREGTDLQNCKGLKITITTKKNNSKVTLSSEVYYRN